MSFDKPMWYIGHIYTGLQTKNLCKEKDAKKILLEICNFWKFCLSITEVHSIKIHMLNFKEEWLE